MSIATGVSDRKSPAENSLSSATGGAEVNRAGDVYRLAGPDLVAVASRIEAVAKLPGRWRQLLCFAAEDLGITSFYEKKRSKAPSDANPSASDQVSPALPSRVRQLPRRQSALEFSGGRSGYQAAELRSVADLD